MGSWVIFFSFGIESNGNGTAIFFWLRAMGHAMGKDIDWDGIGRWERVRRNGMGFWGECCENE